MPNLYRLKISLVEPHYPINALHRIIDVQGDVNFYELHQAIFDVFERHDEHLWQFFVARQKMDSFNKLYDCQEQILLPDNFLWQDNFKNLTLYQPDITLDSLQLNEKDYLYYWFDFGDDWLHRIRIEKISQSQDNANKITVIKKVGDSPKQYDEPNQPDDVSENVENSDFDFEMTLVTAMMLIATGGNGEPVRWQELVDNGIADELVKRKLIKPCISPTHKVRLTPFGESELVRFMEITGMMADK